MGDTRQDGDIAGVAVEEDMKIGIRVGDHYKCMQTSTWTKQFEATRCIVSTEKQQLPHYNLHIFLTRKSQLIH